jgi:SAM-dependent methyltransferase
MNLSDFILENGVYCQKHFDANAFEKEYISVRTKEGRIVDDETAKCLPFVDDPEWKVRAASAQKLLQQLKKENCKSFLEIGCGNGWLTNYLQREMDVPAFGIDINKTELTQAARLSKGATFIYGDIFSLNDLYADTIIIAACIQYFPDPDKLIDRLNGTIHIVDSPFYKSEDVAAARERSRKYFASKDASGMEQFYFHHSLLKNAEFLYKPDRIKILLGGSPFPWIRIRKGSSASSKSR